VSNLLLTIKTKQSCTF